jgi:hypothetical protein
VNAAEVIHYALGAFHTACGQGDVGFEATETEADVTCLECRAEIDVAEAVNRVPSDPAALAAATADLEAEFPDEDGPAIACSSMHEHDPATCAAPSVAEMTLEAVGSELADLYARILGVFEDEADTAFALSKVGDRIEVLLTMLRVPVPAAAFVPSSVCPVCEARLSFNRWGEHSEAWVAEQVRLHVADCQAAAGRAESAPAGPVEAEDEGDAAELRCPHCRQRFVPSMGEAIEDGHRRAFAAHVASCSSAVPSVTG